MAVTEKFVELRPGFPTMPLRARGGAKPEVQDSLKAGHESHLLSIDRMLGHFKFNEAINREPLMPNLQLLKALSASRF